MSPTDQATTQSITATIHETRWSSRGYLSALSVETKIVLALLTIVVLWGLAIFTFGVPALVWPMKIIVPGLVLSLVLLTWGM